MNENEFRPEAYPPAKRHYIRRSREFPLHWLFTVGLIAVALFSFWALVKAL